MFFPRSVPSGYTACLECGIVRETRSSHIQWLRGKGESCRTCGNSNPSSWLRNLTTDKVRLAIRQILSKNKENDREAPSPRSCGHNCCQMSTYNPFGPGDTMFIEMLGLGTPRRAYNNQTCCACSGYSAPCTMCIRQRMLKNRYFSHANPNALKKVLDKVLASDEF